jgi:phosphate uptake regulator
VIRNEGADVAAVGELECQVLGNLGVVIEQLDQALESIARHEARLAWNVLAGDEQIVKDCVLVHQRVLSLLEANRLGAAGLLVTGALFHVVRGTVRIESEWVKIADVATAWMSEERGDAPPLDVIERAGRLSLAEVSLSKQAFALRSIERAHDAARADADLRALNRDALGGAAEVADGREVRDRGMFLFLVACRLERIGDSALDIAEQTVTVDRGLCARGPRLMGTPVPSGVLARPPRKRDLVEI